MLMVKLIRDKIERIRMELMTEKNLRNKELLEERIMVLEELLAEYNIKMEEYEL